MPRYARYQLSLEEMQLINQGAPIRLHTFGGSQGKIYVKSLRNVNTEAFADYLIELTIDGKRYLLSAAELKQATESV